MTFIAAPIMHQRGLGARNLSPEFLYGITGFTASDFYHASTGGTDYGSASGFALYVLYTLNNLPSQEIALVGNLTFDSSLGHEIHITATGGLRGCVVSGLGTMVYTPEKTLTSGDLDKTHLAILRLESGTVKLASHGADVGSGNAVTGYSASPVSVVFGRRQNSTTPGAAGSDVVLHEVGAYSYSGTLNPAWIQTMFDYTKFAATLPPAPGVEVHRWVMPFGAPASIPDLVGSANMTRMGAPATAQVGKRRIIWGW